MSLLQTTDKLNSREKRETFLKTYRYGLASIQKSPCQQATESKNRSQVALYENIFLVNYFRLKVTSLSDEWIWDL